MSGLSTHVLDLARGRPAVGVPVRLERRSSAGWDELARTTTGADGRVGSLLAEAALEVGVYRLTFDLATYFAARGEASFFPEASVVFEVKKAGDGHHIPLLLSPYGYSTYRGS